MHTITLYSTPNCPYCQTLKAYLDNQSIRYEERNVAADAEAREELKKKSNALSVPVIDIDGTIIIGFDLAKIEAALDTHQ